MSQDRRYFTLTDANRTLPLVERIVRDIVEAYPGLQERLRHLYERTESATTPEAQAALETLRREVDAEAERINAFIRELGQIGCEFKGFDLGLVDFYARHEGRTVLLCWQLGEDRIGHWHDEASGYAGRQEISPEMARSLDGE